MLETQVSAEPAARVVFPSGGQTILTTLSGAANQASLSEVLERLESCLPIARQENDEAGAALEAILDVTSQHPLQSVFLVAAYLAANNLVGEGVLESFLLWVKAQNASEHLLRFVQHSCPTTHGFITKLMSACCHLNPPDLDLLGSLRSHHHGGYDEISQEIVKIHNIEFVKHALEDMRAETVQGVSGGRLLRKAVKTLNVTAARALVEAGAEVNIPSTESDPQPCLIAAINAGDPEMVRFLLDVGADPDAVLWDCGITERGIWNTALGIAVAKNSLDMVKCLVAHGADTEGLVQWTMIKGRDAIYRSLTSHDPPVPAIISAAAVSLDRLKRYLIEQDTVVSDKVKELALLCALREDRFAAVRVLLSHGVDANASHVTEVDYSILGGDEDTSSPLILAVRFGRPEMLKLLISHGADLKRVESDILLEVVEADYHSFSEIAEMLIDAGLDKQVAAPWALVAALQQGHFEALEFLLDSVFSVDSYITDPSDEEKEATCLQIAAFHSHDIDVLHYLIERGANPNHPASLRGGYTAIQGAIKQGNLDFTSFLLGIGADVNASSDDSASTSLELACEKADWQFWITSLPRLVQMLLDNGADVVRPAGNSGTLLHCLLRRHNTDALIRRVLGAGATTEDLWSGKTPLQHAAEAGRVEAVKLLLEYGADICAKAATTHGRTALQAAASAHCPQASMELVRLLLDKGAEINERPAAVGGITALQGAAIRGHINLVQMLIGKGAEINNPGAVKKGRTAIEGAAEHGRLDTVQLLLDAGATGDVRKGRGLAPAIELARKQRHFAVVELLREHQNRIATIDT